MTVYLSPLGGAGAQFFDDNGDPLSGGKLYSYAAGTTTPQTTYTTSGGTVPHANPIILDAAGRVPNGGEIWLNDTPQVYKFILEDSDSVLISTWDNISGINATPLEPISSTLVLFQPAPPNSVNRTVQAKLRDYISRDDYESQAAAIARTVASSSFYLNNRDTFEITVGSGGSVTTINAAIDAAVRMRPVYKTGNEYCTIRLLSGFVMQEQILIAGGTNLGWIKIVADDAVVTINEAYITEFLDTPDNLIPAFGARENSVLPTIGCQFAYVSSSTAKDGVAVILGSKVGFMPETGVIRARNGLKILYDSEAYCYMEGLTIGGDGTGAGTVTGVDFSYAANRGCHVAYGSRALLARSNFSYSGGDYGVYCIWGSYGDLYQSNASHAAGTAFNARDGSFLNCRECNASYSTRGFHALHNGRINARSRLTGPTMIWVGDGAKGCSEYGVLASANSQIDADSLNCDECTGSAGVSASDASSINFYGGTAKNCTERGVWSQRASSISAFSVDASGCNAGFVAENNAFITCAEGIAQNCTTVGALASTGSRIDADQANFSGSARGVEAQDACTVDFRDGIAQNCSDRGVSAIDGGRVNCQAANLSNAGLRGITARNGAHVAANNAICTGAGAWAAEVINGSIIAFNGATGTPLNVTANTLTANGIIFQ
jgi:hypothetical protein